MNDAVQKAADAVAKSHSRARLWHRSDRQQVVRVVLDTVDYDTLVHENAAARQLVPNLDDYLEELRALAAKLGPRPACPECGMGGDVGGTEPNPIPF